MDEKPVAGGPVKSPSDWPLPSWSKISEFVLNVIQLQRSVEALKAQNTKIQEELSRLQRQSDQQSGELKALLSFIDSALHDRVDARAERAAAGFVERLINLRVDSTDIKR